MTTSVSIHGTTFDLGQANPRATTSGWTKSEREGLSNEGLVKFKDSVVKKVVKTPLSANLSVSSYKPSEMDSKNNFFYALGQWSVASLVFQSFMKSNYLSSVFTIVRKVSTTNTAGTIVESVVEVGNLFTTWHSLTIEDVFASCDIHMKYSTSVVEAQNLNLSWEFLLANVDLDLKASVIAEVSRFIGHSADAAQSGPMAFYVIANRLVRASDALAHHAVSGLMAMGLLHFKGEDVVECVSVLRNVLLFLGYGTPTSKAPPTIMDTLIDVFLRCSSPVFVSYIRNLKDFHSSRIATPEQLFVEAQTKYNELVLKPNGWLQNSKSKSAFLAEMPELAAVLEQDSAWSTKKASTKRSSKQSHQASKDGGVEKDKKGRVIDRNPPQDGVIKRKRSNGFMEFWCAQCNRWGSHDDDHHDEWWKNFKERRDNNNQSSGNGDSNADKKESPPSMKRLSYAQVVPPSMKSQTWSAGAYDSDQSF